MPSEVGWHLKCISIQAALDAHKALSPNLGVLVDCDPAVKSIIVSIDSKNHEFIIEDLDERRVVVKENMVAALKKKLDSV